MRNFGLNFPPDFFKKSFEGGEVGSNTVDIYSKQPSNYFKTVISEKAYCIKFEQDIS